MVTPEARVARWAERPMDFGLGCGTFKPRVLGPAAIPRVTDAAQARGEPGLAILSALAHGDGDDGLAVLLATLPVLDGLHLGNAKIYYDLVLGRLSAARQLELGAVMNVPEPYIPTSKLGRRLYDAGQLEGAHHLLIATPGPAVGHAGDRLAGPHRSARPGAFGVAG